MHIVWVLPNPHPNLDGWIKGLNARGHQNSIEAVRTLQKKSQNWTDAARVQVRRVPESRTSAALRRRVPGLRDKGRRWFFPPVRAYLRHLDALDADAFIVRPHSLPVLLVVSIHCRRQKLPLLVYEQHDPRPIREWWRSPRVRRHRRQAIYGTLRLRLLGRMFGTGMMSPVLHSDLETARGVATFVPFAPDADTSTEQQDIQRDDEAARRSRQESLHVLMVARFIPRKHHEMVIESVESLRNDGLDVRCTIVGQAYGPAEENYAEQIQERITDSVSRAAFSLHVNVSSTHGMADHYRSADVFVLPAEREPASVAIVEALRHGLPVLVTETCGTAAYVKHGESGLHLEEGSKESVRAALKQLATDEPLLERFRHSSIARSRDWLNPVYAAERIEKNISSLGWRAVSRRRAPRSAPR
jgi:glycosyltransferase involved in cell wall biosynthesis